MQLLDKIKQYASTRPKQIAIQNDSCGKKSLTYEEVDRFSDVFAQYIDKNVPQDKSPIIVYGNKNPYMLVMFLACVKTAHPYCPIDTSVPKERMMAIIEMIQPHRILATEALDTYFSQTLLLEEITEICAAKNSNNDIEPRIHDEDIFYILFTSGSTGKPKGVEITAECIDHFLQWSESMVRSYQCEDFVFLNQSPFSFDLSVMDVYTSLYTGGTLYIVDDTIQVNFKYMLRALEQSDAVIWVSTPSLADMCLMSKKFSKNLIPRLKMFFFCGEVLTNITAQRIMERFPDAVIINAYGPTEATVAITSQIVTKELAEDKRALPVGKPKLNCEIEIWREDGTLANTNETGEIIIKGDTVGRGYFKEPELTEKAFVPYLQDRMQRYAYKTGDKGYLDENGVLHFCGRADMQIQFHGYRIELNDIEKNLLYLDMVSSAVVLPSMDDTGRVKRLVAFIAIRPEKKGQRNEQEIIQMVKGALRYWLPQYMIPSKIICLDELPRNKNGKIDRRQLETLI